MSFTRFHDDPCRIQKQVQEAMGPCNYILNVPGNGLKPCYMEDPYIRMQKWGGNLMTNPIDLESRLRGMDQKLSKDCIAYDDKPMQTSKINYPTCGEVTAQPRAVMPAWTVREQVQTNFNILPSNPQDNALMPFESNQSTRILAKDNWRSDGTC